MSKPQAAKRHREQYRTAADRSTKSRQDAHRTGVLFERTIYRPNLFRQPIREERDQ